MINLTSLSRLCHQSKLILNSFGNRGVLSTRNATESIARRYLPRSIIFANVKPRFENSLEESRKIAEVPKTELYSVTIKNVAFEIAGVHEIPIH